jgi:hypothetical protein
MSDDSMGLSGVPRGFSGEIRVQNVQRQLFAKMQLQHPVVIELMHYSG